MDDLPDIVEVFLVCPVDDRIGVWVELAAHVDKTVNLGFRSRYLDREWDIKFSQFASEAPDQ